MFHDWLTVPPAGQQLTMERIADFAPRVDRAVRRRRPAVDA
jgi:hypothetical protein